MNIFLKCCMLLSVCMAPACSAVKPLSTGLLQPVASLPPELEECSGMVAIGHDLYVSNNDSGNPAELYVYSLEAASPVRTVRISGATNTDWEELAADDRYIYIGDTGNNKGRRKDLAFYRISKEEVISGREARAEKITFYYPEQTEFGSSNTHNFDCEAFVCYGDSLYLFTKNRGDQGTDLYRIPKTPGHYAAEHIGHYAAGGLVTGADLRTLKNGKNKLALVGYALREGRYQVFVLEFEPVKGSAFFMGGAQRFSFDVALQTESILFTGDHSVYISNEAEHGDKAFVYRLEL